LTASGRYTLQSDTPDALAQKPQIEANFAISRGEFTNIDLLRATQSSGSSWFGGGRTAFEEVRGSLKTGDGQSSYRAQVASGPLSANGTFTINAAGQLNGRANTELNRNGEITRTALKVGGTSREPLLGH